MRRCTHIACILAGAIVTAQLCVHLCTRSSQKACPERLAGASVTAELRATEVFWYMLPHAFARHCAGLGTILVGATVRAECARQARWLVSVVRHSYASQASCAPSGKITSHSPYLPSRMVILPSFPSLPSPSIFSSNLPLRCNFSFMNRRERERERERASSPPLPLSPL